MNQTIIVGRLTSDLEVRETESGKKVSSLTLTVPSSFKNADGEYDTDFIDVVLWEAVAENTAEYCKKGDIVGIKGRIQTFTYETEDGSKTKSTEVVAEKVTILSSKKYSSISFFYIKNLTKIELTIIIKSSYEKYT